MIPNLPTVNPNASLEELREQVAILQKTLNHMMDGFLGSANMLEVGGWMVGENTLSSYDGAVGLSSIITDADDIRMWAGDIDAQNARFRVHKSGKLVATGAEISGNIHMKNGSTIDWNDIGAPYYDQINGYKPPPNADNTDLQLMNNGFTKIGPTYIYTGTLTAGQINAVYGIQLGSNAYINWSEMNADPKTGAAQSTASYAADIAQRIGSGNYSGTFIDGKNIISPNIYGGQITSNTSITVNTEAYIGEHLNLTPSFRSGIRFNGENAYIRHDPLGGAMNIVSFGAILANGYRIDQPMVAKFA